MEHVFSALGAAIGLSWIDDTGATDPQPVVSSPLLPAERSTKKRPSAEAQMLMRSPRPRRTRMPTVTTAAVHRPLFSTPVKASPTQHVSKSLQLRASLERLQDANLLAPGAGASRRITSAQAALSIGGNPNEVCSSSHFLRLFHLLPLAIFATTAIAATALTATVLALATLTDLVHTVVRCTGAHAGVAAPIGSGGGGGADAVDGAVHGAVPALQCVLRQCRRLFLGAPA